MEIDEVMLGDLVSVSGRPIHVTLAVLNNWSDSIEPILLTPEILEKNGFTLENKVKNPARYICNVLYKSVIVDFDCYNNGRGATKCILAGVGVVSNSYVRIYGRDIYVHQLQHALRLCGINKEIEL